MKIGILTLPLHTNIGGILQAYALQKVVKDLGHDVETIDLSCTSNLSRFFTLKRFILRYLLGRKNLNIHEKREIEYSFSQRTKNTSIFVNKYIKRRIVNDYRDINSKDYDVIIVGSDQVWRPGYWKNIDDVFLNFAYKWNIKRIAYAISFGSEKWEFTEKQTLECSELARLFNAISVREDSAVDLCEKMLGVNSIHVLDPTMLMTKNDYLNIIPADYIKQDSNNLMYYILDKTPEKEKICNFICEKLNLTLDDKTSETENVKLPLNQRIQIPVEEWLSGFVNAEYVFTDSFHGCVFSIIFNKPFFVYLNEGRGSARYYSLLRMFGLENRIVSKLDEIDQIVGTDIDWGCVNNILNQKRDLSYNFLIHNLK